MSFKALTVKIPVKKPTGAQLGLNNNINIKNKVITFENIKSN